MPFPNLFILDFDKIKISRSIGKLAHFTSKALKMMIFSLLQNLKCSTFKIIEYQQYSIIFLKPIHTIISEARAN